MQVVQRLSRKQRQLVQQYFELVDWQELKLLTSLFASYKIWPAAHFFDKSFS